MPAPPSPPSRIEQLSRTIPEATRTSDRLRLVANFLDACEQALRSVDHQERHDVFLQVAYLLGTHACDAEIWDWLQEMARTGDLERQVSLRIAILELVPDPPVNWSHVFRLWDMWFDPKARWAVYAAYHPFPRRIHQHLRRYQAHCRRHGLPVPDFSEDEFHAVLTRHAEGSPG